MIMQGFVILGKFPSPSESKVGNDGFGVDNWIGFGLVTACKRVACIHLFHFFPLIYYFMFLEVLMKKSEVSSVNLYNHS